MRSPPNTRSPVEIDERLVLRRRQVAENTARIRMSRLLIVLSVAVAAALVVWVFRSPLLAVEEVRVLGVGGNRAKEVAQASGIRPGQPLVSVRPDEVERTLVSDPRVETVEVQLWWPHTVTVEVTPRPPVAWVFTSTGWNLVGRDGVVLDTAAEPDDQLARVRLAESEGTPTLGVLAFVAELDRAWAPRATVISQGPELWADIAGIWVRLGRPVDMEAKARALNALLATGVEPGSTINLLAPARPAVVGPMVVG
ncbi:MAG: cell division protein FtsQ/DivIB [Actinomycetota bacterium]